MEKNYIFGSAQGSDLYTNKYFTGKSSVKLSVHNANSKTLTVKIFKNTSVFAVYSNTVSAKSTLTAFPSGLDKSGKYYIEFKAPSSFDGYVE